MKNKIIFHGSPCQDFSLAGKQAGGDKDSGTRSSLLYETIRIVEREKPKYVIWENVKNVISKKHRHNFDNYLNEMESLGYTNYWQVLNAKDYGIPQNRERVFTISILNGDIYEFPKGKKCENKIDRLFNFSARQDCRVVYDKNGICPTLVAGMGEGGGKVPMFIENDFTFPPKQELKLRLKDMLEDEVDEKYYLSEEVLNKITVNRESENCIQWNRIGGELEMWCRAWRNIAPTVNTKCQETKVLIKEATKQGYKEAYEGDSVNLEQPKSLTRRGRVGNQVAQTLTTACNQGVVEKEIDNLLFCIFDLCGIIDTKEIDKYERSKDLLSILWKEVAKKEIWEEIRRLHCFSKEEILRPRMYEKELFKNRNKPSDIHERSHDSKEYQQLDTKKDIVRNMWEKWKNRYTSQGWELEQQQFEQFNANMSELSYENTQEERQVYNMPRANERTWILQQTLYSLQEIWKPTVYKVPNEKLRIRKLSPLEVWRLMGFDDEDFDKASKVNSNSQLYKQAGNSIVVNVLEAIFNNLLDKNEQYELIELFGGIGAPRKALQRQGFNFKTVDFVEIDKYAVKSYNAIFNENFDPKDIKNS